MGRSNHELLSELWDISQSRPLYRATMSPERFKYILRFIRFDDRQSRNKSDRLAPIKHIFLALLYPLTIMVLKGHDLDTSLLDKKKNKKERKKDAELHKKRREQPPKDKTRGRNTLTKKTRRLNEKDKADTQTEKRKHETRSLNEKKEAKKR